MLSPFHACYKARTITNLGDNNKFVAAFASSDIEIYPYYQFYEGKRKILIVVPTPLIQQEIFDELFAEGNSFDMKLTAEAERQFVIKVEVENRHEQEE